MAAATLATPLFDIELSMSLLMEQLGLEDIGAIHRLAAGASTVADDLFATEEYALRIQAEYLGNILQIVEDHRFALALDEGLEANYPAFRDFDTGTNPPAPDNQRVDIIPVPPENDIVDEPDVGHYPGNDLPNSTLLPSSALSASRLEDQDGDDLSDIYVPREEPVFQVKVVAREFPYEEIPAPIVKPMGLARCIICEDQFTEEFTIRAPCHHDYCRDCLINFVTTSTRDESVFPPKCCDQQIPSTLITPFLPVDVRTLFVDKDREYAIPISDRIYCPTSDCSAFLGSSEHIRYEVTCNKCNARVCALCKQTAHPGDTCSENTVTQEIRALARIEGWQTCPECSAIIELYQGCFHMTCRCHAQFCYLCAAPWKQCSCPQWDENRL